MNDQERDLLQRRYPNWNLRRPPEASYLIATRLGRPLTAREIYYGLCATLVTDTYDQLREALADQNKIEETL
jgi:hypothetical protein